MFCSSFKKGLDPNSVKFLSSIDVLNFRNSSYEPYFHIILTEKIKEEFSYRFKKERVKYLLYGELVSYSEMSQTSTKTVTCVVKWSLMDSDSKRPKIKNRELIVRIANNFEKQQEFHNYLSKIIFNRLYKDLLYNISQ